MNILQRAGNALTRYMEEWTGLIADRAPNIKEERANALRERLSEALSQNGQELEEGRFLQEAVILADRLDVSEELTRLNTHLARLHDLLQTGGDAGRRLDFTLQECFREINTCGNKLPDVQLSRMAHRQLGCFLPADGLVGRSL